MEKKLNIGERLSILTILPGEGSFLTLRLIRELKAKLGLSADELNEFEVKHEGEYIKWNEKGKVEQPMEFKDKEIEIIKEQLLALDKKNALKEEYFSIYEKFVDA